VQKSTESVLQASKRATGAKGEQRRNYIRRGSYSWLGMDGTKDAALRGAKCHWLALKFSGVRISTFGS